MNFRERLFRLMQGRNGIDSLFYGLSVVYILLMFLNIFFHSWFIYLIGLLICFVTFYRVFSRNIFKRSIENQKFERIWFSIKNWWSNRIKRIEQNKNYCFKRCPNCGKTLRLPRVKGKHSTRCPSCGAGFNVKVWLDKRKKHT